MGKHLDHISDSLLREINEDVHELNQSLNETRASIEALQRESEKLFSQHFENLQKVYIELSEHASQDIQEECKRHLDESKKNFNLVVDTRVDQKLLQLEKLNSVNSNKKSKLLIGVLIALVIAISFATFVAGSYLEQTRFDKIIEVLPYLDNQE